MTTASDIFNRNKTLALHAATLETGRAANDRILKMLRPKLPMMVRGYVDHPMAKLAVANAVSLAVQQYRPANAIAAQISDAMIASAYQEFIATFDIPGMLDELFAGVAVNNQVPTEPASL